MQRTDRLFEIIQILRAADGPVSAAEIAARMELSTRTVYRHVATLQAMRLPIEGAPGFGYVMGRGYDLPPIALDADEREAVVVGLGLLARTGDRGLVAAARRVLDKITEDRSGDETRLGVSGWGIPETFSTRTEQMREAVREGRRVAIAYRALNGDRTERAIRPRALVYYVEVAVVEAWCELRDDVRHFRVDGIEDCKEIAG